MAKIRISFKQRQVLGGLLFTFPFIVGSILFFIYPFVEAVIFSLNELQLGREGYSLVWQGLVIIITRCLCMLRLMKHL